MAELFVPVSAKKNLLLQQMPLAQSRSTPQVSSTWFNCSTALLWNPSRNCTSAIYTIATVAVDYTCESAPSTAETYPREMATPRPYPEPHLQGTTRTAKGQEEVAQLIQEEVHPVEAEVQQLIQPEEESRREEALLDRAAVSATLHRHQRDLHRSSQEEQVNQEVIQEHRQVLVLHTMLNAQLTLLNTSRSLKKVTSIVQAPLQLQVSQHPRHAADARRLAYKTRPSLKVVGRDAAQAQLVH